MDLINLERIKRMLHEAKSANTSKIVEGHHKIKRMKIILLIMIFLFSIAVMVISIQTGVFAISFKDIITIIMAQISNKPLDVDERIINIVINIRLPRVIMGSLVGAGLGVAGALMQTLLMNSMASPFTLGISSGAGLGASLSIIYGFSLFGLKGKMATVSNAFVFAILVSLIILLIAQIRNQSHQDLVLAGIAFMNLFSAVVTLLTYFADVYASKEVMYWQVGTLGKADWQAIMYILIALIIALPYIFIKTDALNKMAMGDEVAESLGVEAKSLRMRLMFIMSLMVGTITAFTGVISFIGLVVPHIVRLLLGSDNKYLIPGSALGGILLLVAADTLALNLIAPKVLPVGVLTAFIGSPVFLMMIFKSKMRR